MPQPLSSTLETKKIHSTFGLSTLRYSWLCHCTFRYCRTCRRYVIVSCKSSFWFPKKTGPDAVEVSLHLNTLTSHLSVYLPISEKNLSITAEVCSNFSPFPSINYVQMEDLIQHLNLDFSKLYTLSLLWNVDGLAKNSAKSHVPLENLWSRVSNWTRDTMSASVRIKMNSVVCWRCLKATFNHPMGRRLSEGLAQSLLPILWTLISQPPSNSNREIHSLLQGLLEQIQSQGVLPKTKITFIRFMAMLVLVLRLFSDRTGFTFFPVAGRARVCRFFRDSE